MRGVLFLLVPLLVGCDAATVIRATSLLGDTTDHVGPYKVLAEVSDGDDVDSVWLQYSPHLSVAGRTEMQAVSRGVYEGTIPGQPSFTLVRYFVEAIDGDRHVTDPVDATDGSAALYSFWVLGRRCGSAVECDPGELCDESGSCRRRAGACEADVDCGKGFRCLGGTCRLAVRSCTLDEGCLGGEVCSKILGQCIVRPRCDGEASCPLDFSCDSATGLCRRACMGSADCGPGETCAKGVCSGAVSCAGQCAGGLLCDPVLKYCRPPGAGLCAPCVLDADCGGPTDFCLLLPGGQFCGRDCSRTVCPAGYSCNTNLSPAQCAPSSGKCQ
jgi:hypothetical protein